MSKFLSSVARSSGDALEVPSDTIPPSPFLYVYQKEEQVED